MFSFLIPWGTNAWRPQRSSKSVCVGDYKVVIRWCYFKPSCYTAYLKMLFVLSRIIVCLYNDQKITAMPCFCCLGLSIGFFPRVKKTHENKSFEKLISWSFKNGIFVHLTGTEMSTVRTQRCCLVCSCSEFTSIEVQVEQLQWPLVISLAHSLTARQSSG